MLSNEGAAAACPALQRELTCARRPAHGPERKPLGESARRSRTGSEEAQAHRGRRAAAQAGARGVLQEPDCAARKRSGRISHAPRRESQGTEAREAMALF